MKMITLHLQWVVQNWRYLMKLRVCVENLTLWFRNNCMKVNPDKFHLLLSDRKIHQVDICNEKLSGTCSENHLGIKLIISLLLKNP